MGELLVDPDDGGGYNGSGIVLYADYRYGWPGAEAITNNRVLHNKIGLVSDTPFVVDVVAIELTEAGDLPDPYAPVICENIVAFNDLRGTTLEIELTPVELWDCNTLLRNVGVRPGPKPQPGPLSAAFGPGE